MRALEVIRLLRLIEVAENADRVGVYVALAVPKGVIAFQRQLALGALIPKPPGIDGGVDLAYEGVFKHR